MQSLWARITSSIMARGSRWNEAWSSRLAWPGGGARGAEAPCPRSPASARVDARRRAPPSSRGPWRAPPPASTWSFSSVSSLARPSPTRRASRRTEPSGIEAVARGAEAEDGVRRWPAADRRRPRAGARRRWSSRGAPPTTSFSMSSRQLRRADPVAVERLADPAGRQRRAVHPGAERAARPPHDDDPHLRISRRRARPRRPATPTASRSRAFSTAGRFSVMVATPSFTS